MTGQSRQNKIYNKNKKKKDFFFCHKILIFLNYQNLQVTFFSYNVTNISQNLSKIA